MIILTNTTDSLQVVLSQNVTANQMQCYAAFRNTTSSTIIPSSRVVVTNNTTAVDVVQSPGSSTQRIVDFISIHNVDTLQNDVIVRFNDNGTTYILFETRLNVGEKLEYHDGKGFKVINSAGGQVTSIANSTNISSISTGTIYLPEDVSLTISGSTNVITLPIPKLSFPVIYDKVYTFKFNILYDVNSTTVGTRVGLEISNFQTNNICAIGLTPITSTTATTVDLNPVANIGNTTSNSSATTTENCTRIDGIFRSTFNGLVGVNAGHEVVSGATMVVKKGSMVHFQQLT